MVQKLAGIPELLDQAMAAHQAGKVAVAETRYLEVLKIDPEHFEAQHWFGILRAQQGHNDEALSLIGGALKANPASAMAHLNYGNVLHNLGRHDEALESYDKSIAITPDSAATWSNRGN